MSVIGQSAAATVDIPLATTLTVTFLLTPSLYPTVVQDVNLVNDLAPPYNHLLGVSRQQLAVVFGTDLSSQVLNSTNALWSSATYATYPETTYLTYQNDIYETNAQGGLVTAVSNGELYLTKLHSKGDRIIDPGGAPIVQYAAGSVKLDANGAPITMAGRQLQYYVSSMMFDLRLFYSANQADVTFVNNLTGTLAAYCTTCASIQSNLLEQTSLYYMPNTTMGTAIFSSGNKTPLTLNLGFSFALVAYVTQATLDSMALKTAIAADMVSIVQDEMTNPVISLTDIATTIKTQLSDTILSIDVTGIDGNQALQTVIVPSGTTTPIVAQQLVWDADTSTFSLQQAITISFQLAA
jgi:hypothetical protein